MKIVLSGIIGCLLLGSALLQAEEPTFWEEAKATSKDALQDARDISANVFDKTRDESKQVWQKTKRQSKDVWYFGKEAGVKIWDKSKQSGQQVWYKTAPGRDKAVDVAEDIEQQSSDLWQDIIDWWESL